jgi:serine/threonine protein kinase/WD40 repeat protein
MTTDHQEYDPLDELADEYLVRLRRGEQPSVAEYERRFPLLAGRIRSLFPTLAEMERACAFAEPSPNEAPKRIGEFRILRKVGEGGMGVVYEAVQESLGRHVALKVLPSTRVGNSLERFRREARAAARLHHTNIVPVFGIGESDGLHYYAMQFIVGQALDSVLEEVRRLRPAHTNAPAGNLAAAPTVARSAAEVLLTGVYASPVPPAERPGGTAPLGSTSELSYATESRYYREAARLILQAGEGLAYAHEQGILHRDIKPANLLLDLYGTVWVADFGLAKAADEQDLTTTGDLIGTLRYMAPERFQSTADVRSEVYSLGATLYELLTLRPAFDQRDRLALIDQIRAGCPVPPRKLDRKIPRDLETVVLKALARNPADRYQTVAAMVEDLRRFLTDRPIAARRVRLAEQFWRAARRNPAVSGLLAFIVVASVGAAVAFALQSALLRDALDKSERDQRAIAESNRQAQLQLLDSKIAEARADALVRRAGQRFRTLSLLDSATARADELNVREEKAADLRNAYIGALAVPDLYPDRTVGFPESGVSFDFSADHSLLARTDADGACALIRTADGAELCRLRYPAVPPGSSLAPPQLSADGRTILLYCPGGDADVWRLDTSAPRRVLQLPLVRTAELRRDGGCIIATHPTQISTWLFTFSNPPVFTVTELPEGRTRMFPAKEADGGAIIRVHPSEPLLLLLNPNEPSVTLRDTHTGGVVARVAIPQPRWRPMAAAWRPDGKGVVIASNPAALHIYEFRGLALVGTAVWRTERLCSRLEFNAAGDRLVAHREDGRVAVVDAGSGATVLSGTLWRSGASFRWSPDGRRLAGGVARERIELCAVGDGREFRTLTRQSTPVDEYYRCAVDPVRHTVAAARPGGVTVWELATGTQTDDLAAPAPNEAIESLWFEADGSLCVTTGTRAVLHRLRPADGPNRPRYGPAEEFACRPGSVARSADGSVWASVWRFRDEAFVWRTGPGPREARPLPVGRDHAHVDVSPDGKWVVTVAFYRNSADVWNVETRTSVKRLPGRGGGIPRFSPDGRLWADVEGGRLLTPGTWEQGLETGRTPERPAFTPDGRVMALETGDGSVRLVDTAAGSELARLDNPHQDPLSELTFASNGGFLVGISKGNAKGLHVWDLRLIRRQLADRRLDWDAPPIRD